MKQIILILSFLFCLPLYSFADEVRNIGWEDLLPKSEFLTKYFDVLEEEDRGKVYWLMFLKNNIPAERTPEFAELFDEYDKALPLAQALNLDLDKTMAEIMLLETGLNEDLDGTVVRIPGFLLPLDTSQKEVREFLLVPTYGACAHVPPPPVNQIISAVAKKPFPYSDELIFKPVYLTGTIKVIQLSKKVVFADGPGNGDVDIGYSMSVDMIEDMPLQ